MIKINVFTHILFFVLVVLASYEDVKKHQVYAPLLLALIPIACFLGGVSFYVIASIAISVLCISRFFKVQKGDQLAYFVASFFLNEHQILPFFALNVTFALATWIFTRYFLKKQKFPLIPSILFPCLIIRVGPDIMRSIMSQNSVNQQHARIDTVVDPVQAPGLSLLVPSLPIKTFGNGLQKLLQIMYPIMTTKDGIGLAAPQIGYNVQVILLDNSIKKFSEKALKDAITEYGYALINPKIVSRSKEKIDLFNGEGCLSLARAIPGKVERHKSIVLQYQDVKGNLHEEEISMQIATIVQHEMDHLFGILYPARMKDSDAKSLWAKYVKDLGLGVNQIKSFTEIMLQNLDAFEHDIAENGKLEKTDKIEFGIDNFRTFAKGISITNNEIEDLLKHAVSAGA